MEIYNKFSGFFWNEDVWLPPNTTWADIKPGSREGVKHTDYRHLLWPIPMACVIIVIRYITEKYWLSPIGKSIGIKSTKAKAPIPNKNLEQAYNNSSRLSHKSIINLSKQLDLSERQIERWWRRRRAQDKPTTLVKFCENSWRCMYYTYSFIFGIIIMWDKPWLWDIQHCWYEYPHQSIDGDVWWYYMISMAFYWSLTFSQFFDVKRKDFLQMFFHHMITLLLISLSWMCNLHRVGSLVLLVHDCADILLEGAKLTKYANYQKACDVIFAVFTFVWIFTRLGLFPRIIYSTSVEAPRIVPMFPAYYIFNTLLILLLILHCVWTYMILQIAIRAIRVGQMDGDVRSSSDEISDSSRDENREKPSTNGTPKREQRHASPRKQINQTR